jgi:DNA-binding winged helix-turn-helix (wHTH) protein
MTQRRSGSDDLPRNGPSGANGRPGDAASTVLTRRPDFNLGASVIRPSLRRIEGAAGTAAIEPRVMRVLVAFADAGERVLGREDLLQQCWDGAVVGDDAINRTIAEIRRVARETGGGFGIETIPRVGYRLTTTVPETVASNNALESAEQPAVPPKFSRRGLVAGVAVLAAAGGMGLWLLRRPRRNARFDALVEQARQELRLGLPGDAQRARARLLQAVELRGDDAAAHGLLADAWMRSAADTPPGDDAATSRQHAHTEALLAVERALRLDAWEPNARAVFALLDSRGDWLKTDSRLRAVLDTAPDNNTALDSLVALLQGAGYVQESHQVNERAIAFDSQRPMPVWRRALKLWILGEDSSAVRAADFALERWSASALTQQGALVVYAFTGEYGAARKVLDLPGDVMSVEGREAWRVSLVALERRSAAAIARARAAMEAVAARPVLASHAILVLATLGELDAAYAILEGRGFLPALPAATGTAIENAASRWHQWLFCPAARPLHADARFTRVCDRLGLLAYWRDRQRPPEVPIPWLAGRA